LKQNPITSIADLVRTALSRASGNKAFFDLQPVNAPVADRVFAATGIDVHGWVHSIDESAVRHIFNRHGSTHTEMPRGQLAVTLEDLERIAEVVSAPDQIEATHPLADGTEVVVFKKRLGHEVLYVQEMRVGRKKLTAKTLWKVRLMPLPDKTEASS
jgi:phage-Barnase-EndoU-ColicinE5/D-RelE like nuclease3